MCQFILDKKDLQIQEYHNIKAHIRKITLPFVDPCLGPSEYIGYINNEVAALEQKVADYKKYLKSLTPVKKPPEVE